MKKIRLEDLSVGDWVNVSWEIANSNDYSPPKPCVVKGVVDNGGGCYDVFMATDKSSGELIGSADLSRITPIPITTEILKANGFSCVEVGDKGPATPKAHYMRYEKWRIETQLGYRDLFFDRMTKRYKFGGMNEYTFTEVHKLQHALRFSGFDKEILL